LGRRPSRQRPHRRANKLVAKRRINERLRGTTEFTAMAASAGDLDRIRIDHVRK
jgi:hypothetical protein